MTLRISFLLVAALVFVACGGDDDDDRMAAATAERQYGGTYTMNVLRGSPNGLDPVLISSKHADDIASQIFDKLIDLDEKLEVVPELARELPTISDDGRIYRFHLRTDVNFHDNPCFPGGKGRRMTAYDVKYSLTRCCDPRTRTVAYWAFQDKVKGATEYFEAVNRGALGDVGSTPSSSAPTTGAPGTGAPGDTSRPSAKSAKATDGSTAKKSPGAAGRKTTSGSVDSKTATSPGGSPATAATSPSTAPRKASPLEIEGFRVIDDSTFEIELVEAYAPFLFYLVNSLGSVVPFEAVDMYGANFFRSPVGTGPFVFASWSQDQELVLRRNPAYFQSDASGGKLPYLDSIRFLFVRDDKMQFNEFLAGNLDESFNLPTERFEDVFDAETGKGKEQFSQYQLQTAPAMLTWFCDFLTTRAPFDNADVRRAFNYAIDREKIVRYVLKGSPHSAASHGIVPPVFSGYPIDSIDGYSYDPARAKELFAKAGYPNGEGFPAVTMHIYPEPRLQQTAEALQEMLRGTLGVNLQLQTIEFPQLSEQSQNGRLAFWGARWYGDYPDPETFLNMFNGSIVPDSDTLPSYPNSTRYRSAAFDKSFLDGVHTIDYAARMRHYVEAERTLMADAPIIPLFYERHFRLLQPWVHDVKLDAMARYDLKYAWIDRAAREEAS